MNTLFNSEFSQKHEELQKQLFSCLALANQQEKAYQAFQALVWHYYYHHKRDFPWREIITPYRVVVSEIMLQQTQTDRVAQKFDPFLTQFPDFKALADAPFHDVLRYWKGLGYNRRAISLQKIAQLIISQHHGQLPTDPAILETFPSIGKATARSILAFTFNSPTVFIETNIRTVYFYFFFKNKLNITDKELEPLVASTVDHSNPREWYYALMDYGVMLKKTVGNVSRLSAHYAKQSKFEGSDRQIRGMILQILLDQPGISQNQLVITLEKEESRVLKILTDLCNEGFVKNNNKTLVLKETL